MKYSDKYEQFYNSKEWKQLRRQVMQDNDYLCAECKRNGKIRQATQVHHKVPIEEDYGLRLEYDNMEALCNQCHNVAHERRSQLSRFMEEWNG